MITTAMTLSRSIILSLTVHLVLFGTGFAFARYAGIHAPVRAALIIVDLLDAGDHVRSHRTAAALSATEPVRSVQPSSAPEPALHARPEIPVHRDIPGTAVPASMTNASRESAGVPSAETGIPGDDKGDADTGSASLSSDQWQFIGSAIERSKNYPRRARERGMQGVVLVRFRVAPTGGVERVEILRSSGHDILDTASVSTIYRAAPLPYVRGWIEVPISYVLQ